MSTETKTAAREGTPTLDLALLDSSPSFRRLIELVHTERRICGGSLWGSSQSFVLASLMRHAQGPWVVCLSTETEADLFHDDLVNLGVEAARFPARESTGAGADGVDPESVRGRLQVAQLLAGPPDRRPRVLVASLLALLQPLPPPGDLEKQFLNLQAGQHLDVEALLERLVTSGYTRQPLAERPGEVSLRGDILDVFAFAAEHPVRIELFDEEIESLRTFESDSQRSIDTLKKISVCLASDAGDVEGGDGAAPMSLVSPTTVVVQIEPLRIDEQAEGLRIQSSAHAHALISYREDLARRAGLTLQSLPAADWNFETRTIQGLAVGPKEAPSHLKHAADGGARVFCLCESEAEASRFGAALEAAGASGVEVLVGSLAKGFRSLEPDGGLVVVNHRELLGVPGARRHKKVERKLPVRALESFFELEIGDLVVHAVHGVARFVGLENMTRAGGEEEHIHLRFADEVSLYVPVSRIDLVQRYVGTGGGSPELDKIGGQAFRRRKEKVERALVDLAAELLEVQAKRATNVREPWSVDPELVRDMLEAFPYEDTKDQTAADQEIARDLGSKHPMDRLLCGDVGFGKTEVAMRAAFRVVSAGGQTAVLVPTTVLAQQHYQSFKERFADFPIEVEVVSRYVQGKRAKEVISRCARGEVDVLVGTHRLLSKDIAFQRLGLLIIDEEQRFGVAHKEHFKQMRSSVDILTLTATPIPRTLHMSLSGVRDISALAEPPPGRQEIDTVIGWTTDEATIRRAFLREKNRGGQVFFLHNRVQSIEHRVRELMALVPECTYAIGHGQMSGNELREVMGAFTRGEADVLVATTIIENGIDIPTAGTILIDDADRFGLAELHQLRGRVGRGRHKSHCYLLIDKTKPLKDVARKRIKALEELTQLGAGFQISMKDLEIRGAGNILGPEQSGHIAAVGYDMYCRLLKATVERLADQPELSEHTQTLLKSVPQEVTAELEAQAVDLELGLQAYLPTTWIPEADARLELFRKLNEIETESDAEDALAMMRDRYGRVPGEACALVEIFLVRSLLSTVGIRRVQFRAETYIIEYTDRIVLEQAFGDHPIELRPLRAGLAHLVIPSGHRSARQALDWLREALGHPRRA